MQRHITELIAGCRKGDAKLHHSIDSQELEKAESWTVWLGDAQKGWLNFT